MRGLNLAMRVNFSQNANSASNGLNSTHNDINWADCFANLVKFSATPKVKRTANAK